MRRSSSPRRNAQAFFFTLLSLLALASAGVVHAETAHFAWQVTSAGVDTGQVAEFERHDGVLYASAAALAAVGITHAPAWTLLDRSKGWDWIEHADTQSIELIPPTALRDETVLDWRAKRPTLQKLSSGFSVDYDANAERVHDTWQGGVDVLGRAFGEWGVFADGQVWTHGGNLPNGRLDTYYEYDQPEGPTQWRIGDNITATPQWARAVRFGGLHWGTDFSLRPDLVTFPLPAFAGSALVPSTLDVLVNGVRTSQTELPPGPFSIPQLPVFSNAGTAQIVLTDALGRQSVQQLHFFADELLLRGGLADYSVDAGALRRSFPGDRYDTAMASGSYRYGLNDDWTLESHAEATSDFSNAGAGVVGRLGSIGTWRAAAARSEGSGCAGSKWQIGGRIQMGSFNADAQGERDSATFCDLGGVGAGFRPRATQELGAGYTFVDGSNLRVTMARSQQWNAPATSIRSINWARAVTHNAFVSATLLQTSSAGRHDRSGQFTLVVPFGDPSRGATVSSNTLAGHHAGSSVRVDDPVPAGPGWGGYAETFVNRADSRAGGDWRTPVADFTADIDHLAGETAARLGATGSIGILSGGTPFAARTLGDSFAVIDTGAAGVTVLRENQPVATTDAHGVAVVPMLLAFQDNHLALDPLTLPADVALDHADRLVAPYRGGGVRVAYATTLQRAVRVRLVDAAGAPLGVGQVVLLAGAPLQATGHDGEIYVALPPRTPALQVRGVSAPCEASPTLSTSELQVFQCRAL